MALTKSQLQSLIEKDCTQQGAVAVPGPVLRELVDSYIESVATSKAAEAAGAIIVEQNAIVNLVTESATAPQIATAVNSILAALRANGILATE